MTGTGSAATASVAGSSAGSRRLDDERRRDGLGRPPAALLVLGHDPAHERGERRHVEQAERDPDLREILGVVPAVQATPGDQAHLVVELRPADVLAAVAEADELQGLGVDCRRLGRSPGNAVTGNHRWPTLQSIPSRGSTKTSTRGPAGSADRGMPRGVHRPWVPSLPENSHRPGGWQW